MLPILVRHGVIKTAAKISNGTINGVAKLNRLLIFEKIYLFYTPFISLNALLLSLLLLLLLLCV